MNHACRALTVLIADDEPVARRGLRRLIESRGDLCIVGECDNGETALDLVVHQNPDLVVLDVQMPGLDGIEVVRRIGARTMPMVVFVTAFDEFAIAAFEMAAVDYVMKPFSDERLMMALDRALGRRSTESAAHELGRLLDLVARETRDPHAVPLPESTGRAAASDAAHRERFLVSIGRKNAVIAADEIAWIRASGYYATLITRERKEFFIRVPLEQLERELDPRQFLRVHRSAIVRLADIHELERSVGGARIVVLTSGQRIPISKSRRDAVFQALGRGA